MQYDNRMIKFVNSKLHDLEKSIETNQKKSYAFVKVITLFNWRIDDEKN